MAGWTVPRTYIDGLGDIVRLPHRMDPIIQDAEDHFTKTYIDLVRQGDPDARLNAILEARDLLKDPENEFVFYRGKWQKQGSLIAIKIPKFEDVFDVKETLGAGSFGTVYKAETKIDIDGLPTGSEVAVKVINISAMNNSVRESLEVEIDILRTVTADPRSHPYIVKYYGSLNVVQKGKQHLAIIMENINGSTLQDFIDDVSRREIPDPNDPNDTITIYEISKYLTGGQVANIMRPLLEGLLLMHEMNIVHRDIKDGNIMFDRITGTVKYIDFGFACIDRLESVNPKHQCKVKVQGTPAYLSPELVTNFATNGIDPLKAISTTDQVTILKTSDVWALGMTFFVLMYGTDPYSSDDLLDMFEEIKDTPKIQMYDFEPDPDLVPIVESMLTKDYKIRPRPLDILGRLKSLYEF